MRHTLLLAILFAVLLPTALQGQTDIAAKPVVGLRENPVPGFALVNAEVVVSPVVVVSFVPLELFVVVAEEVFVVLWLLWEQVQEMLVVALVLVEV